MSELEVFSKSIVKAAAQKLSPLSFLGGQVRKMDREDVDKLAIAYLLAQVNTRKRAAALETERDAQVVRSALSENTRYAKRGPESGYGTREWNEWASEPANSAPAAAVRAEWKAYEDTLLAANARAKDRVDAAMSKYVEETWTEWTDKLLRSKFALGDGTETTWGAATREQHLYRINMHKAHAVAGIEGAARHQQAIDELDATGCLTLADAVTVAA